MYTKRIINICPVHVHISGSESTQKKKKISKKGFENICPTYFSFQIMDN